MKCTDLESLLQPGESVGEVMPAPEGGTQVTHRYRVYPVMGSEDGADSNAVFLDIASGGSTEPEHTVRPGQELKVEARRGRGNLVVYHPDGVREIRELRPGMDPVRIGAGVIYYYLNTGDVGEPLTVFDRSRPAWQPDDEVHVEPALSVGDLKTGDYVFIWNPRQPGGAGTAGALRLAILEQYDTTESNRLHGDQSKFVPTPPHAHALAQRVGEDDIWPVNVRQDDEGLWVTPHRQAPDAIIGPSPEFPVQSDRLIFMRPRS